MSSFPYVLSQITDVISIGMMNFIIQTITLIVMMLITKKFSLYYALSFGVGFIFGLLADGWGLLFKNFSNLVSLRILFFICGWIILALSIAGFQRCDMPLMPFDVVTRDITKARKKEYSKVKSAIDIIFVLLSLTSSFIFFSKMVGVGFGTIFQALVTGKFVGLLLKCFDKHIEEYTKTKAGEFFYKIKAI